MCWILQYPVHNLIQSQQFINIGNHCSFFLTHIPAHSYHAHTIQVDTARVEKQTFVCTEKKSDAVPSPKPGVVSKLGNWKSPKEMDVELNEKFKGCMKGVWCTE